MPVAKAIPLVTVVLASGLACSSSAPRTPAAPVAPVCASGVGTGTADAADSRSDGGEAGWPGSGFVWTVAAPAPIARFEANGVVVDDELWVLGGFTSADLQVTGSVDIYDPTADAWRPGPALPGAQTHIAVVTLGGDVIVGGGFVGAFTGARPPTTDAVWRWGATTGMWSAGPALPAPGAAFAWALLGTAFHVAGGLAADGSSDSNAHSVWDLAGAAMWTTAAPLPESRNHGGGAASGGLFYAIAGRHGWNESSGDVADVDAFDPVTGSWTSRAPIPLARSEIGAATTTTADGRIVVVGGSISGAVPSADVLVYDPAVDAWCALPSLPEARKGTVAARIGSVIVVTGGSPTSVDPSATTFVGCCVPPTGG
jgi:N-acetylneuraminic acid mutarotase